MRRRCGGTGALTIGLAGPRSGKQAILPLLTCTNPISGDPPMRGSCSYSVSCSQLTQRMCHPCSWAGNRRIGALWSAGGGLMFLGSRSPTTWSSTFPRRFHRRRRTPPARSGAHRAVRHRRLLRTGSGLPRAPDPVTVSRPGHGGAEPPPSANGCDLYRRITHDGRDGRQPTVPARTCAPIATRCGRSRWPSGPWTARSAARTRSSASTSSRALLLRTSGLRFVPETPGSPERAVKGGAATT